MRCQIASKHRDKHQLRRNVAGSLFVLVRIGSLGRKSPHTRFKSNLMLSTLLFRREHLLHNVTCLIIEELSHSISCRPTLRRLFPTNNTMGSPHPSQPMSGSRIQRDYSWVLLSGPFNLSGPSHSLRPLLQRPVGSCAYDNSRRQRVEQIYEGIV